MINVIYFGVAFTVLDMEVLKFAIISIVLFVKMKNDNKNVLRIFCLFIFIVIIKNVETNIDINHAGYSSEKRYHDNYATEKNSI